MAGMSRRRGQRPDQKTMLSGRLLLLAITITLAVLMVAVMSVLPLANSTAARMGTASTAVSMRTTDNNINNRKGKIGAEEQNKLQIIPEGTALVECSITTSPMAETLGDGDGPNGILQITVRQDLSPIASKVFLDLVTAHYFDGVFIFRVLKGFIAQWGVHHAAAAGDNNSHLISITKPPKTKDTVHDNTLSNLRGTLSFAGGNPATQQVFANLGNNARLDQEDSHPFATVNDQSMQLLDQLYTGYKDGQGQIKTMNQGAQAVREKFPRMSRVDGCRVVSAFSSS